MKTLKLLGTAALLVTAILSTPSCGKYEEGPGFTLLTKKMRITNEWDTKEIVAPNGDTQSDNDDSYTIIEKDGTAKAVDGSLTNTGSWEFSSDKEKIRFTYEYFGVDVTTEFTILRLTNKELWLRDEDNYIYKAETR